MPFSAASQRLYYYSLYLAAFLIPFPFIFSPIALTLTAICWIFSSDLKNIIPQLKTRKALWLYLTFFVLHGLSYFYSSDRDQSLFDLQTKVSFLALPFIIGTGSPLDREKTGKIFASFICGLSFIALYCLVKAGFSWRQTGSTDGFFYHRLIEGLSANAVYYALYTFLALTILLLFSWTETLFRYKWVFFLTFFILMVFFILLSSRTLLLLLFLFLVPIYLKKIFEKSRINGLIVTFLGILLTGLVFFTQNPIHKRYRDLLENSDKTDWQPAYSNGKKQHFNNLTLRFFLWETALSNINEHNLWIKGCGNGGVIPLQKEKISEYGTKNELLNVDPPLWDFNIHNMYLQSLMMLGLPGLFVFILILFYPFTLVKYLNEKAILVFFNCSIIIFMIQESAFQTQAGIVFYTFFSMVFYSYVYSLKDKSMQDEMKFITQVQAP